MALWEEAFRNICGIIQLRRQGIPQPALRIAPELIAIVCLWLICCDATGHCLKLASDQQSCKDMGERLVGRQPRLPCLLPPSAFQTEMGSSSRTPLVSVLPQILPSHMGPVMSGEHFLHLTWTFVLLLNQFTACASMLMGKILEFRVLDLDFHLNLETMSSMQHSEDPFQTE